ncbi:hypothetical protein C8Q80DRAFT_175716 [Daedaleopsis nitida]|nr:hypothetical protein C8Q80DRAFT_175716 [Daedaleopsis nitida]
MASSSRLPSPPCTHVEVDRADSSLPESTPQSDSQDTESTVEFLDSLSLSGPLLSSSSAPPSPARFSHADDDCPSNSAPQSPRAPTPTVTPLPEPIPCDVQMRPNKYVSFVFNKGKRRRNSIDRITEAMESFQVGDPPSSSSGAVRNNVQKCKTARADPVSRKLRFKVRNLCRDPFPLDSSDYIPTVISGVHNDSSPRSPTPSTCPPVVDVSTGQEEDADEGDCSMNEDQDDCQSESDSDSDHSEDAEVRDESDGAHGDETDGNDVDDDEEHNSPEVPMPCFPPRLPTRAPSFRVEDESAHTTHAVLSSEVEQDGDGDDEGDLEGDDDEDSEGEGEGEGEAESHIPDSETRTPEQLQAAAYRLLEEILDTQSSIVHPISLPELSSPVEHHLRPLPEVENPQCPSFVVTASSQSDLAPQEHIPAQNDTEADILGDYEDDHGCLLQRGKHEANPDEQSRSPSRRSPSPPVQAPTERTTVAAALEVCPTSSLCASFIPDNLIPARLASYLHHRTASIPTTSIGCHALSYRSPSVRPSLDAVLVKLRLVLIIIIVRLVNQHTRYPFRPHSSLYLYYPRAVRRGHGRVYQQHNSTSSCFPSPPQSRLSIHPGHCSSSSRCRLPLPVTINTPSSPSRPEVEVRRPS